MKKLTQEVKDEADKYWSFRAKTFKEANKWLNQTRVFWWACSFCEWFGYDFYRDCKCPLHDNDNVCCKEVTLIENITKLNKYCKTVLQPRARLKDFNAACEAMQNRIRSLKVG